MELKYKDLSLALLAVIIWGAGFPIFKIGLYYSDPVTYAFFRASIGTIVLLLVNIQEELKKLLIAYYKKILVIGFLNTTLLTLCLVYTIAYSLAGIALILIYSQVLFTSLLARVLIKEKLTIIKYLGILIGFSGIILVSTIGKISLISTIPGLLGGFVWGLFNTLYKKFNFKENQVSITALQSALGTPIILLFALLPGHNFKVVPNLEFLLSVLYQGALGSGIAYLIWFKLLDKYKATLISSFSMGVPAVALTVSWILLNEQLTLNQLFGISLVFLGILLVLI
jgi:EamA-like transporter family.